MILFPFLMFFAGVIALFAMPPAVILFWGVALVYLIVSYRRSGKTNEERKAEKEITQRLAEQRALRRWAVGYHDENMRMGRWKALDKEIQDKYDIDYLNAVLRSYHYYPGNFPVMSEQKVDVGSRYMV